jgi:hypothetical protein
LLVTQVNISINADQGLYAMVKDACGICHDKSWYQLEHDCKFNPYVSGRKSGFVSRGPLKIGKAIR